MRSGLIQDSRLEAIAGTPGAVVAAAGGTAPLTPATAFDGRTLYLVYQCITITAAFPVIGTMGDAPAANSGTAGITFEHQAANNTGSLARFDTLAGQINAGTPGPNGIRAVGLHVAAITLTAGATSGVCQVDGSADATKTFTAGSGIPDATIRLKAATANDVPIAAYGYLAAHDRATRSRILHWLQRRYTTTAF